MDPYSARLIYPLHTISKQGPILRIYELQRIARLVNSNDRSSAVCAHGSMYFTFESSGSNSQRLLWISEITTLRHGAYGSSVPFDLIFFVLTQVRSPNGIQLAAPQPSTQVMYPVPMLTRAVKGQARLPLSNWLPKSMACMVSEPLCHTGTTAGPSGDYV